MQPYANLTGDSGVRSFEIHDDYMDILFEDASRIYNYHANNIGRQNLETMKRLAKQGQGLATFINQHPEVRTGYTLR
jgi:hypothetical protein